MSNTNNEVGTPVPTAEEIENQQWTNDYLGKADNYLVAMEKLLEKAHNHGKYNEFNLQIVANNQAMACGIAALVKQQQALLIKMGVFMKEIPTTTIESSVAQEAVELTNGLVSSTEPNLNEQ